MRKLLLALLLALASAVPAASQPVGPPLIACNKVAVSGTLTAGTTQLVAGVAGQIISVCGFNVEGLATGTAQLTLGTGSTCTSATSITANFTVAANQNIVDHSEFAFVSGLQGQTLCAVVTGTNSVAIAAYYTIQ